MAKTRAIAEFGDFQTPVALARDVCAFLVASRVRPASLLEPTCGAGNFLLAGLDAFPSVKIARGADVNASYIEEARTRLRGRADADKTQLTARDFFVADWREVVAQLPEPVLIVGNPPWVTNAHLGALESRNLPAKSNFQQRHGLDAVTGKANFDISEWMLIRLLEALDGRSGTLAMLCKASVARKTLHHGWRHGVALQRAAIHRIDADLHFGATVDAVLLVAHFQPGTRCCEARVYPGLSEQDASAAIGYEDDILLADIAAYRQGQRLSGRERLKWRSGVKHDCARVMELRREGSRYRNGCGELVELEDAYLYPLRKSSGVANGGGEERWMIVTQRAVNQDTAAIEHAAPMTWRYLRAHADALRRRRSSIYRNRPPFSIFGVGEYSFAPWKVAISGFYKRLVFTPIGPSHGKPVMLDDTSYFLPCRHEEQAEYLAGLLNSPAAAAFFRAYVFWDAKRPITAELLRRLDLWHLAEATGTGQRFDELFGARRQESPARGSK